jgi:SAM-dependent methyltransferase
MALESESRVMALLRRNGFESLAWALRRFHTPVLTDALVLEVGAGGNPYPRANVLLDAYESTRERHWVPLVTDRPTVLGFVENLPFQNHAFDYVIASHVLEHSSAPEKFISELQRVAMAGYIEVPDAFLERVNPYRDHRLEITYRDQKLVIRKKSSWQLDDELIELYEDRVKGILTSDLIPRHPFEFHVRYYWENCIAYTVLNPETDAAWPAPASFITTRPASTLVMRLRHALRDVLRGALSQRSRNANIDLLTYIRCPSCHGIHLKYIDESIYCADCMIAYPIRNRVFAMNEGFPLRSS